MMPRFLLPAAIGRPAFRVSPMSGFSIARQKMVDGQVRTSDVTDPRIIDAMLAVPREAFVPPKQQPLAYLDLDLPVSAGGTAKRFLIKPARATIVTRSHGDFGNRALFDATAPVLPGLERLPAFVF